MWIIMQKLEHEDWNVRAELIWKLNDIFEVRHLSLFSCANFFPS